MTARTRPDALDKLRIIPLGGLGEIGLNLMVYEFDGERIAVDCGLMFPEVYMPGIDLVIPDIRYLKESSGSLLGYVLTHGHEDHIGALPFALKEVDAPVYATRFTMGLIREKLREHGLASATRLHEIKPRQRLRLGPFHLDFLRVTHSIVDTVSLVIETPAGILLHTGDFKFDQTPMDGVVTDISGFAEWSQRGILALLSDSTNVEVPGTTPSEQSIVPDVAEIFHRTSGRIIVTCFSSNVHRVQQIVNVAASVGRRVAVTGRSIMTMVKIATELGYLQPTAGPFLDVKDLDRFPSEKVVLVTTGSQGEPMSVLSRIARDDYKPVDIQAGDAVIFSARFIPGNEKAITTAINLLYRRGAEVYHEGLAHVHASGHASQEELKMMINLTRPQNFIPIHGEYRHLKQHCTLARNLGHQPDQVLLAEDGQIIAFDRQGARALDQVETGRVFVDGRGVGDVSDMTLRDRRHLAEDGMVIAVLTVDTSTGGIISGPDLLSRGFAHEDDGNAIFETAKDTLVRALAALPREVLTDRLEVEAQVRRILRRYFTKTLDRRPVVFPIVNEM